MGCGEVPDGVRGGAEGPTAVGAGGPARTAAGVGGGWFRAHRYPRRVPSSSSLPLASRAWRVLATLVCLGVLVTGGLTRSNDLFPFGVLDQFSFGTSPDGEVVNTCLQGVRGDGEPFDIPFGARSVGIERADIENTLPSIEQDPELLAPLAAHYDRRHAEEPPLTALVLCQRITTLQGGTAHGEEEYVEVTRWVAP